jgi:hypothetical protein
MNETALLEAFYEDIHNSHHDGFVAWYPYECYDGEIVLYVFHNSMGRLRGFAYGRGDVDQNKLRGKEAGMVTIGIDDIEGYLTKRFPLNNRYTDSFAYIRKQRHVEKIFELFPELRNYDKIN